MVVAKLSVTINEKGCSLKWCHNFGTMMMSITSDSIF
jgi:hypothetical protein